VKDRGDKEPLFPGYDNCSSIIKNNKQISYLKIDNSWLPKLKEGRSKRRTPASSTCEVSKK